MSMGGGARVESRLSCRRPGCIQRALICKICSFEELTRDSGRAHERAAGKLRDLSVSGFITSPVPSIHVRASTGCGPPSARAR